MAPQGAQSDAETVLAEDVGVPPQAAEPAVETVLAADIAPTSLPPAEDKTVLYAGTPAGDSAAANEAKTIVATAQDADHSGTPTPPSPSTITDERPDEPDDQPNQPVEIKTTMTVDVPLDDGLEPQRKESIEDEIARHKTTIQQMEQMIQAYPTGSVPSYLNQGLTEARQALADAEQRLATMASSPAPEEIARLEQLMDVHRGTIAQFEQMRANYPVGAVPSFLEEGLKEARHALALVEAEITALREGKPLSLDQGKPKQSSGPRLELFDGKHAFPLPIDHVEFIIGREDPVSQIFPEVDLTAYGGEAGGVSRQHARINRNGEVWSVTDLASTNHTRVDGQRIEPNTPTTIQDGTRLQFGRIAAVFRLD
jgi:hypothetical protein